MGVHKRGKFWYAQFQIDGKAYICSTKTMNKNQALAFERKWRNEVHAKEYLGDREPTSLRDALDGFLRTKDDTKNYQGLVSLVRVLKTYFGEAFQLHELTTAAVERFVQQRRDEGRKTQTIYHGIHVLRGAWKFAHRMGYRTAEIDWPTMKRDKGRLRYLTIEEEKRLLMQLEPGRAYGPKAQNDPENWSEEKQQARQDNYDLIIALLDTGARYSEIAKLDWKQVNLKDKTIHLWRSKTENQSVLYMTDRLHGVLESRAKDKRSKQWVFTNKNGGARNHSTIAIRRALKRAGLDDVRLHDLRHTAASRLVQNGLSLLEVSRILGHSNITMTMRYAHLEQRETAEKARDVLNKINNDARAELKVVS